MVEKISELRLGELLGYCAIIVAVLSTFLEVSKVKINPWSALGRALGRIINKDVIDKLDKMEAVQAETRKRLDEHIYMDDQRTADIRRTQILRFNRELLRDLPHTMEDYLEAIAAIDYYESYCREHQEYKNNRAVLAIANIKRSYQEWMEKHNEIHEE